jgi:glutamate synthase (ferredoxin)
VRHVDYTGSQRGQDILEDWETFSNKFIKILPEDYERVLLALKKAEERGLKGDDAAQAAFEENVAAGH